jgi:hypothetical protein
MTRYIYLCVLIILVGCERAKNSADGEQAPVAEWLQLFNGKDLDGWTPKIRGYDLGENYGNTFRVSDSLLQVGYENYSEFNETFGHLFYKNKYSYYILNLDYRFSGEQVKGGPGWAIRNSGAMLHCQDPSTIKKDQDFPISIEVQLLGGNGKDERTTANLCTPGTNVVMDGKLVTDHCISSSSKTFHGDQWVNVKILVLGDSLFRHYVNGEKVLEYQSPQIGGGNVSPMDSTLREGTLIREGYISLQSESHPVSFRNVKLLDLSGYRNDHTKLKELIANEIR